jgi:hypothetical protein
MHKDNSKNLIYNNIEIMPIIDEDCLNGFRDWLSMIKSIDIKGDADYISELANKNSSFLN